MSTIPVSSITEAACPLTGICQHNSLVTPCTAGITQPPVTPSCDDVVTNRVLESSVEGPHSLHTAEATGFGTCPAPTRSSALGSADAGVRCGLWAVAEMLLVSMGGCITSALTDWSAVEVVGAVLGTVSSRTRRGLGAVAAG